MLRVAPDRGFGLAAAVAALTMLPSAANAALPPYWQSAREIAAIVEDQRVHDALKYEEPILSIALQEPVAEGRRVYELTTERCSLLVSIVYKPTTMIGPAAFDLDVSEARCQ